MAIGRDNEGTLDEFLFPTESEDLYDDELVVPYLLSGDTEPEELFLSVSILHEQLDKALGEERAIRLGAFTLFRSTTGVTVSFGEGGSLVLPRNAHSFRDAISKWQPAIEGQLMAKLNSVLFT